MENVPTSSFVSLTSPAKSALAQHIGLLLMWSLFNHHLAGLLAFCAVICHFWCIDPAIAAKRIRLLCYVVAILAAGGLMGKAVTAAHSGRITQRIDQASATCASIHDATPATAVAPLVERAHPGLLMSFGAPVDVRFDRALAEVEEEPDTARFSRAVNKVEAVAAAFVASLRRSESAAAVEAASRDHHHCHMGAVLDAAFAGASRLFEGGTQEENCAKLGRWTTRLGWALFSLAVLAQLGLLSAAVGTIGRANVFLGEAFAPPVETVACTIVSVDP